VSDNRITMNESGNAFSSELRQMGGLDDYAEKPPNAARVKHFETPGIDI